MRVLIIGNLEGFITAASKIAINRGAKVTQVEDVDSALGSLRSGRGADIIMIDVRLEIARMIKSLESERIHIPVVACGIGTEATEAVAAIRAGAKEYIPLPPDPELIAAVLEAVSIQDEHLLFKDPIMHSVLKLVDQIAPSEASVMITGESGTGKEVMAKYIHRKSRRKSGPFISVNCAAIPENLLESELFGHEKGAFTGAVARRIGKFEEASNGTLLLDEVSEMHPKLQAKLLRAIQEREIDRIGGTQPIKVNIRLIATSNRDLEAEVKSGNFREDLYYRLNVVGLKLPSLRDRPLDIELLSNHFVDKYSKMNSIPLRKLSQEALEALRMNPWPGNVRELENIMHRAILLAQGDEIEPSDIFMHLPKKMVTTETSTGATPSLVGRTVAEVERDLILGTLSHCLGNRTHAANILGISIRTLRNKLNQYTSEGMPMTPQAAGAYKVAG